MLARAVFTVEPFVAGSPGPHVTAAIDAVSGQGFEPDFGPFGTVIEGDPAALVGAVAVMIEAARAAGASRVTIQIDLDV